MNYMIIIDIVVLGFGVYFLYLTLMMRKTQSIPKALLAEEEQKKVKDVAGFIKYLFVPMTVSAVSFILLGICCLVLDLKLVSIPNANYVLLAAFLIMLTFYIAKFRNARLKFVK